jgi:hypothetical protein
MAFMEGFMFIPMLSKLCTVCPLPRIAALPLAAINLELMPIVCSLLRIAFARWLAEKALQEKEQERRK